MKKEDIEHLAKLARLGITEAEAVAIADDFTSILGYVSEIEKVTGTALTKEVGALYNVMREDGEPHPAGLYTEALLSAAPTRDGQYVKVKKILESKK